ncbi:MAG: WecB/TagA/CpsF family glycosyltransferase [Caulobacterales bacterium]|nr:WecB/TagA/CpsF family glycosyltransferase [Caulobacterales bacterium]
MTGEESAGGRVYFLGLAFDALNIDDVVAKLSERSAESSFAAVVTPNCAHVVRIHSEGPWLAAIYRQAWLCLNDSRVLSLLASLSRKPMPTVAGSDLTVRLFEQGVITADTPICVVGGAPEMVEALAARYGLLNVAHVDAPMDLREDEDARQRVVEAVEAGAYRFIFLAVGSPQQEMIAAALQNRGRARGVALCVGSALDFATGMQERAPRWMRKCALEWAFRLGSNPKRLWRRYVVESPKIVGIWIREMLFGMPDLLTTNNDMRKDHL